MINLTEKEIIEYFHKCFTSVDGLWFLKVEETYGFDTALELDKKVWLILPKIQARFLKERIQLKTGCAATLLEALKTKLALDGFKFELNKKDSSIEALITECPWHNILKKAKREELSSTIGSVICPAEYKVFAAEFNPGIKLKISGSLCTGKKSCTLRFTLPCAAL
ncbi:MAG: hypothetical protein FJW68_05190 [Actinobacteria bacterium]|nr:hypothetical protein [Actinomycetota bacterium]